MARCIASNRSTAQETEDGVNRAEAFGADISDLHLRPWDYLSASAAAHPDREALVSLWQPAEPLRHLDSHCLRWTYRLLHDSAERLAASLSGLGCGPGMHLAAILWNSAEWALFFWAAARLDMVFAPIDARAGGDVQLMLSAVEPQVLVVQDADLADGVAFGDDQLRTAPIRIHCSKQTLEGWLKLHQLLAPSQEMACRRLPAGNEHDHGNALIIFTSGTTGAPKGCLHTRRNLMAQTHDYDPNPDPSVVDRWLVHTPVSHIFAINNALRAWRKGDAVVFPSKCFDVSSTAQALVQEKCTVVSATPTLVKALLSHKEFPSTKELGISLITIAGTSVGLQDIVLCRQGLGARDAIQAYGMSEGGPLVSWSRRDPLLTDGYRAGVGKVLPGAAIRICRPGSGHVLERQQVGELHIGGPSVISSYLGGVDSGSFYRDASGSWLVTGDEAKMDSDGVLHIMGRYNELIIRGGENIHPARIESALAEIPGLQAQVIGVPDDIAGQLVVAVAKLPRGTSKAQVSEKARTLGSKYAVDAVYTFDELGFESLPVTSLGKPRKGLLREAVINVGTGTRLRQLSATLVGIWEKLTGQVPSTVDKLDYFSDSITLLRYCDCVLRLSGKRLYLQDLSTHDTIEKQARLLLDRDAQKTACNNGRLDEAVCRPDTQPSAAAPPRQDAPDEELWSAAREKLASLGLDECEVEDLVPVRSALQRMIAGQRPESFHVRLVFRVAQANKEQVRRGLERGLALRPILRAVACRGPDRAAFQAVVAARPQLFDRQIREAAVGTEREARERFSDDDGTALSDFMFAAEIITVRESDTGQCYLSATYNHAAIDAVFLLEWHRDLGNLIGGLDGWTVDARSSFSLYADLVHQYQDSLPARACVAFHVARLRGISCFKQLLWPPQRAPGWMISRDDNSPHAAARRRVRERVWAASRDGMASEFRHPRRSRAVCLPALPDLRRRCGMEPVVFATCAVVVFNVLQTGSPYAVFNSWESGRSWPFVPGWIQGLLPPPMSIDGPTAERVLNMVELVRGETLRSFFRRMVLEHERAAPYGHAPWDSIVSELRDEGPVAVDASFRQSFVWDVSMGIALSPELRGRRHGILEPVARHDWADFGFCWNMFLAAGDNLVFVASWDTAQMNVDEVEQHCDCMADVMRRLANETNWDKRIDQVFATQGRGASSDA